MPFGVSGYEGREGSHQNKGIEECSCKVDVPSKARASTSKIGLRRSWRKPSTKGV